MKTATGRGGEIRTPDLLLPKQALYQAKLHPEKVERTQRAICAGLSTVLVFIWGGVSGNGCPNGSPLGRWVIKPTSGCGTLLRRGRLGLLSPKLPQNPSSFLFPSMDTIGSREPNSMLPVGAIIVGVIGLLLGGYSALTIGNVKRTLAEHEGKMARFDQFESQVSTAASASEKATRDIGALTRSTQDAFNQVGAELGNLRGAITKLEEAPRARAVAATPAPAANRGNATAANANLGASTAASSAHAAAGAREHVVKSGDTGVKIAREHGVSLAALQNANPDVNWNRLHVGQKLALPR